MIIKFIAYFSILNLILLSVFLLFRKEARKSGMWIFATSMLIVAYTQWIVLLFYTGEIKQFYYLAYSEGILFYLFVPMFYLYVLKLIGDLPGITLKHAVHLLPAIPGLVYYIVYITGSPEMRNYSIESKYCGVLPDALLNIIGNSIQVFYIFLSFRKLNRLKKIFLDNFSNYKQTEIQWIYFLLFAFAVISASYLLLVNIISDKKQVDLITLLSLDLLFFAIFIKNLIYSFSIVPIFEGTATIDKSSFDFSMSNLSQTLLNEDNRFKNYNEFKEPLSKAIKDIKLQQDEISKQYKPTEIEIDQNYQKIIKYMQEEKPYLDPNINLTRLSSTLDANSHNISMTLNKKFRQNFFDFINSYRVVEAQRLLNDLNRNQFTIEAIGFDSGFNSKAAFYRAFKKHTGTTPSEYILSKKNQ
jgi:AraC-like DNA-binding protein